MLLGFVRLLERSDVSDSAARMPPDSSGQFERRYRDSKVCTELVFAVV